MNKHDRIGSHAVDAWSKAEYWQQRTAGVISHALYVSTPGVRMGRIKTIEAELRGVEKQRTENAQRFETWRKIAAMTDPDKQTKLAEAFSGIGYGRDGYKHPRTGAKGSLWSFLREDATDRLTGAEASALYLASHTDPLSPEWEETNLAEWANHYKLRLSYENQMLEAQGGRAAFVEMEVGGWIGNRQIRKVNKSPATGRVVSVTLKIKGDRYGNSETGFHLRAFNIERLPEDAYRAPSEADKAAMTSEKQAEKAAAPAKAPCPLINPTNEDAQRLQDIINARAKARHEARKSYTDFVPVEVCKVPQAVYSANSKGTYAQAETRGLCRGGELENRASNMWSSEADARSKRIGPAVCQVRVTGYDPYRVVMITDKPQKPFPSQVWEAMPESVTV
jgi:primosomal replication protein N